MTDHDARLTVLEDIFRAEQTLAAHPSWQAWRLLDAQIASHSGPDAKAVGALVGGFATDLAGEPAYVALLAAREKLRILLEPAPAPATEAASEIKPSREPPQSPPQPEPEPNHVAPPPPAAIVIPPPPGPPASRPKPLSLSDVAPLPPPPARQPEEVPRQPRSSLLDRIAKLERETTSLMTPPRAASPTTVGIEEAEVDIVTDDELPIEQPRAGLVSRLEALSGGTGQPTGSANRSTTATPVVDEAEVEIVVDDENDGRR